MPIRAGPGIYAKIHYLREIADFSAHTQTDDQRVPLDIDPAEAEWTLDVVERLFDHFIVAPERDRKLRAGMDEKIEQAERKPIFAAAPRLRATPCRGWRSGSSGLTRAPGDSSP